MAILWQKRVGRGAKQTLYEVRSAGRTRRLYTNGVFHSQYNPARPVAGSVWDLLFLPAMLHKPGDIKRVLVLGVGGGAVIKQLEYFLQPESITGVELCPVHLQVARQHFDVKGKHIHLHCGDAVAWLKAYSGPAFDLIIEDLFGEFEGQPQRAVAADTSWCQLLQKHLDQQGTLVMNFDTPNALGRSAWRRDRTLKQQWRRQYRFSTPLYSNVIAAFTHQSTNRRQLTRHLQQFRELDQRRSNCALKFEMRSLPR
ncbi:oxidoreductase [Pseudomaricurvus alkylphenolicus]|jgi:spermidine synthase|uniref:spermidine synthase n=1 Tax=Pseudomaricurvus alkylphenolicus TaxID=1306991 RepID=UPI00142155FD|nr:methyltransferase domain-containing protein [Pseudomaricurvus alkylphenolicus]NIB43744.1 oxidoreductase [Pseudomaricurvus alkylphenolicus]